MTNVLKIVLTLAFLALACSPVKVLDSSPSPVPEDVVVSSPSEVALVTLPGTTPAVEVAVDPVKVVAKHFFVPSVDESRLCHVCNEDVFHLNHKWLDPKDIVCTNPDCTCKQCGSHCGWDCRCEKPKPKAAAVVGRTTFGTQYGNCANGNCGPVSNGRPRLFGRFR